MEVTSESLAAAFKAGDRSLGSSPRTHPEQTWEAIVQLSASSLSDEEVALLAAGPLEDLILYHGVAFIDRIERQARLHASFRHLLGGVWEAGPKEVWARVEKARLGRRW
jgi:hypothetical protein